MPPKIPPLKQTLLAGRNASFICITCQFRVSASVLRRPKSQWPAQFRHWHRGRPASTVAPVSVINVIKQIPQTAQELHAALDALEKDASVYTSLSQLQLALRGLESENAVTRIAILAIGNLHNARRLARVLLADPLAPEPEWEKHLTDAEQDGRAILLRYGETADYDQRHPLLRTLTVPSSTLRTHKLEILVQAIPPVPGDVKVESHTYLVPGLEMLSSSAARYSVVRYPVHKALIFGDGLSDLPMYIPITTALSPEDEMLKGAINTRWINTLEHESSAIVTPVNVDHAEAAITTFRQSLDNSVSYEHTWFSSGVPTLSTWLLKGLDSSPETIKPTIRSLISSLLAATEARILASETEHLQKLASTPISPLIRSELMKFITAWSEKAHTELRDQLSLAFSSPSWRKLAWWKLPWRVDDVGMFMSDVLQRYWLTSTEKELIWLVGRVEQAGLILRESAPIPTSSQADVRDSAQAGRMAPVNEDSTFDVSDLDMTPPSISLVGQTEYPQTLTLARNALSIKTIPPMQSHAQKLVLYALSTTVLTSSLSALVYISISTTSLYEAGAIAAVGAVYSMRRLQKQWEDAKLVWMGAVREEGRRVLRDVEAFWRALVEHGGKRGEEDAAEVDERRIAREAVGKVRKAMEDLNKAG